jgi:hypothetical protein
MPDREFFIQSARPATSTVPKKVIKGGSATGTNPALVDKPTSIDAAHRFLVDTEGRVKNKERGDNGHLTRDTSGSGPLTFDDKGPDTDPTHEKHKKQKWQFGSLGAYTFIVVQHGSPKGGQVLSINPSSMALEIREIDEDPFPVDQLWLFKELP